MTLPMMLVIAAMTYASRAVALVLMPEPSARWREFLSRLPAPLFAGLAALSLVTRAGDLAPAPLLVAAIAAMLTTPLRSLLVTLIGGLAGFALATWLW